MRTNAPPTEPQDTCADFTVAALSTNAALDRGPADARHRAAHHFGTPELTTQLAGEGRDHHWPLLAQRSARVHVTTTPVHDDPPPQTGSQAAAAVLAQRTATSTDGWRHALPDTVAYCTLTRATHGWQVTSITFADTAPEPQ